MKEAFLIAGAIFFNATWTTPSKHNADLVLAQALAILCVGTSLFLWAIGA